MSRSRISLPVLKNGTDFLSTATWAPVRGIASGPRRSVLDREGTEAAQLDAVALGHSTRDLTKNRVDDVFDVALIKVGVLSRNALDEL